MDEEMIIQEMLREDDANKTTVVINPDISKRRKRQARDMGVKATKIALAICILVFLISLFSPWFQLSGETTQLGFIGAQDLVLSKVFTDVKVSPMQLLGYSYRYHEVHQVVYSRAGDVTSLISWVHLFFICTFLIITLLTVLSILLLIIKPGLQGIRVVKIASIITIILCCINFFLLKIPYLNMFVLHAQSVLRQKDLISGVKITSQGIAINATFYPYSLSVTTTFIIAMGLMGIWLIVSAVLVEIKRKRDEDLREIELKSKLKGKA